MPASRFDIAFLLRLGAFIYWMLGGFKQGDYKHQCSEAHDDRNAWTAYLLCLAVAGLIAYLIFRKHPITTEPA